MVSKLKLILDPAAQIEIFKAVDWYESAREGLGKEFYNYLDGYFKTLCEGNVLFPVKRKPAYRELPLKRFPFVIIYEQAAKEIYVFLCFQRPPKSQQKNGFEKVNPPAYVYKLFLTHECLIT